MREITRKKVFWSILVSVVFLGITFVFTVTGKLVEWVWMAQLGYPEIFWRLLFTKLFLFGVAFIVVFLYFLVNLRQVARVALTEFSGIEVPANVYQIVRAPLKPAAANLVAALSSFVPAVIFGLIFWSQWDTYLRFRWGGAFGLSDPVFGLDVGFYVFRLPFYELVQNGFTGLTSIALVVVFLAYALLGFSMQSAGRGYGPTWRIMRHLGVLFLLFAVAWACGYYLDRYELLFSGRGVVFGAGYTDYNIVRIVLWIMLLLVPALGLLLVVSLMYRRLRWIWIGIGGYVAAIVLLVFLLPMVIQRFVVRPNELELESPFLTHNIEFTRKAYQLDRIEERRYPALSDLTLNEISQNQDTMRNIRLWDWRPILQTFRQTQEIRLYYQFYEVDIDRYRLEGEGYRQVMLSARELVGELPAEARTWVNERLQFTHGYGLSMAFVSEQAAEGLPRYVVKDLPPVSPYIEIDQPAIYYGEKMPGHRIVNTLTEEFDYPKGDANVYTHYKGTGGILLDSLWKRLLFAWNLSDVNILISSSIKPESRIQIWRRVGERISRIAPFLVLDRDPYIVSVDGKLYWIQDAYTVSSYFPYSERHKSGLNYIRNSVKIIMDAYNGSVSLYVMDHDDPILKTYGRLFPKVFQTLEKLPAALKAHLRYPQDLFEIQVDKFRTYHMTIPQVFYNREDLWTLPREKYAGSAVSVEPYYILMRLPGEESLQYLLMTPLNPRNRDNMIAWMAARCDFPGYGQIVVYQLPKERLIYGPLQIEAMIDQDDVISQQFSLWDQRGSRVIRGNLLVIPMDHSLLYVEPVFLVAEEGDIPQLKRVIVAGGNKVVMEPTIDEAISVLFGAPRARETSVRGPGETGIAVDRVRKEFDRAQEALGRGDWIEFGKAMERLKGLLAGPEGRGK